MPQGWSSQSDGDLDDIHAWMARRNAERALQPEADRIARDLWNQSIQNENGPYAGNPSDLTGIGLAAVSRSGSYPTAAAPGDGQDVDDGSIDRSAGVAGAGSRQRGSWISAEPRDVGRSYLQNGGSNGSQSGPLTSQDGNADPSPPVPGEANDPTVSEVTVFGRPIASTAHPGFFDSLNHNLVARAAGGVGGYLVGLPFGALRSGWHALEGVGQDLVFAKNLVSSPDARAKAWDDTQAATHNALQYGRSALANPSRLADDALAGARGANRSLNPFATPIPDTVTGAFGHELGIGANDGETLANIAGIVAAPEVAGGINAARTFAVTREANIAKFIGQGLDEQTARYLSKPYDGRGDHALISKSQNAVLGFKTPSLKRAPIPDWLMDSPLNVSKPRGMSQGDFYEYHYGVDPQFYGAKLPPRLNGGKGWSGNRLGLERYSGPGRIWARTPSIWKDYAAGVILGDALGQVPQNTSETPQ